MALLGDAVLAETANIAKLAEFVATNLFARFLWRTTGSWNQNWACVSDVHKPRKTHPTDAVFYYDEPYLLRRTYLNCDLKSYNTGNINGGVILSALEDLAQSLTCIETSEQWQRMYVHDDCSPFFCGLLFVYNHDGEYDKNFDHLLASIRHERVNVPKGSQLVILGPQQIRWLGNVAYELVYMRGNKELPDEQFCRFHYPHLVRRIKVQVERARAATIEMLAGPWITLAYDPVNGKLGGYVIFYKGRAESPEEFLFLIDHLMHYQMVKPDVDIKVRALEPDTNAAAFFERAITDYIDNYEGGDEMATLLRRIEYKQITHVHRSFSTIEVGMIHD
jgi:hypothetical protein